MATPRLLQRRCIPKDCVEFTINSVHQFFSFCFVVDGFIFRFVLVCFFVLFSSQRSLVCLGKDLLGLFYVLPH